MDSITKLRDALKEVENKIQDLKWRCHGRHELMDLYQKREELEQQLNGFNETYEYRSDKNT